MSVVRSTTQIAIWHSVLAALALTNLSAVGQWAVAQTEFAAPAAPQPRAQRLVERTLRRHAELAHVLLHVTPPGKPDVDNLIIASSIGHIGKRADADDLRIIRTGVMEAVVAKSGDRYNVALPLLDRAGRAIGILALGFHYAAGDDLAALRAAAMRIRDELRSQIASARSLFTSR